MSLLGLALYPLLLPRVTEIITGLPPDSEEFAAAFDAHLRAVAAQLG